MCLINPGVYVYRIKGHCTSSFLYIIPGLCLENKEPGLCEAYMPSYYFNSSSSRCERFVYGGCGGNRNRFETLLACSEACTAKCK